MRDSDVHNLVQATLASHLHADEQKVFAEADLFDDLGADSLDVVELTLAFEEMFSVEIADDDLEQVRTVGQLEELIKQKVSQNMVDEAEQGRPGQEEELVQQPGESDADYQTRVNEAEEEAEGEGESDEGEADEGEED
jgi:acyl carrier protein